ncbi:CcmD family protein [Aquiflexum sp. TKW24L]|uniref:CcmD family protein n=1 Tax=Aquiflexum sp. TKW24L TaxID=2942212 RepID=UPI0020C113FA|nr:CcmD family protein [Aquiflexum sp. TKW24L]MCL6260694.1 CcmD family protein [Aquiflexum sp. TKW24L]
MKKWIVLMFMAFCLNAFGQEKIEINENDYQNSGVEMADVMRSEGKIYVLVGIIGIVLSGILVYVISTDRKVARLEKAMKED